MSNPIRSVAVDLDELEREDAQALELGEDVILFPLPIPVYRKLSDAAARRNMTVAQLLADSIARAIGQE